MEIVGKAKFKKLALASAMVAGVASGGMVYGASTQSLQSQIDDLRAQVENEAGKLSINGFISAGVAGSDIPQATRTTNLNEEISFLSDSVVGVQLDFNMTADTKATVQLVGRGLEEFNSKVEWAYISHNISDNWSMKAGRLRIPTYTSSEYIEVGMAYPWVRPAPEVHDLVPFTFFDGASFTYSFSMGSVDSNIQLLTGNASSLDSNNAAFGALQFDIDAKAGLIYTASAGDFRFNFAYLAVDLTSDRADYEDIVLFDGPPLITFDNLVTDLETLGIDNANFDDISLEYLNVGLAYDNGAWLVQSEISMINSDNIFTNQQAGYVSLAHRFGKWTPYIMYSEMEFQNTDIDETIATVTASGHPFAPIYNAVLDSLKEAQSSSFLGVSYDLLPSVKLKAEWRYVEPQDDTKGTFDAVEFSEDPFDHANVYSLVLDAVF